MSGERQQMVLVVWHDAHSEETAGWLDPSEIDRAPCVVQTVGWLLTDAKPEHIVVAQSVIIGSGEVDGVVCVPVGMVQRVQIL